MSEEIDYESLVGKEVSVEGDSLDDLDKNLGTKLKEMETEFGISVKQKGDIFKVCFYSGDIFEESKAYVFGTAKNYESAKKRAEDRIRIGRMIEPTRDYKQNNGEIELSLYPFSAFDFGIVGLGSSKEEAEDNAFDLNLKIQETKFKKQGHVKASFRYKFVKVRVEENERTIKEELEDLGIEEKYFNDFFNKDIKKILNKSNGIIPLEQNNNIVRYLQRKGVIDNNFEVVKEALNSFEARKFLENSEVSINSLRIVDYKPLKAKTYALGINRIKKEDLVIPSFAINLEARIKQAIANPNKGLNKLSLWTIPLYSNVAKLYEGGDSSKFKIVHNCPELININRNFKNRCLPVDYNDYPVDNINVFELDFSDFFYNRALLFYEFINNPGWLAEVQNNQKLLINYAGFVYTMLEKRYNRAKGLEFITEEHPFEGQLQPIKVGDISYDSNSYSAPYYDHESAFFLQIAPK